MKKHATLLWALLSAFTGNAQVTSGSITYRETMPMNITLPPDAVQMKNAFPREIKTTHRLSFSADAAMYETVPEPKHAAPPSGNVSGTMPEGGTFILHTNVKSPEHIVYTDLKEGLVTEQKELLSKKFIIEQPVKKRGWHMTGREKTILNYTCQEATCVNATDTITAWYTTAIPVSSGPEDWSGLPGMILEGSVGTGERPRKIEATLVEEGLQGKELNPPKNGKKVTPEEYAAIEKKKQEEMKQQFGGDGNVIIQVVEH